MTKKEYEEKRQNLINEAEALINESKIDDANKKMDEVKQLDEDFENEAKAHANLRALSSAPVAVSGYGVGQAMTGAAPEAEKEDVFDGLEYRKAFMNYVLQGTAIPEKFKNVSAVTKTSDIGAVISPTVINRIVEKMESIGMILPLVTRTSFAAGATVPTSSVKPVATWVAEGGTSDKQKKTTGQIDIKGYKLRCAIAMTLEASVMSLQIFETVFVNNVSEAMVKAQEQSFFTGTGSGQPKGVLKESVPAGQTITIAATADPTYQTLVDAEAALPLAKESGAVWNMTKKTFMKFIGMVDSNKQPIARVNIGLDGKPERMLLGRKVVLNDYMTSLGAAISSDTPVAFLFDWSDYIFNTNYQMTVKTYEDNDTEDQVTKAVMICDGKAVDLDSLVVINKKSA